MCGRYTLKTPVERLSEKFQFPKVIPLKPRYNIAPSQDVAVVLLLPDDGDRPVNLRVNNPRYDDPLCLEQSQT